MQINHSFWGKYPYHKVPDRKHSERYQDLKALKISYAEWHVDVYVKKQTFHK